MSKMTLSPEQREIALQYGHLFHNSGGNDPIELIEREGVNYFNNPLVAELQGSCWSQVVLLQKLKALGLLFEGTPASGMELQMENASHGRTVAFLSALIRPLAFLYDKGEMQFDAELVRQYCDLPVLERFVWDMQDTWKGGLTRDDGYFEAKYGKVWKSLIRPLEAFILAIPGYDKGNVGNQSLKALEQHGHITMQLLRLLGDWEDSGIGQDALLRKLKGLEILVAGSNQ
uniref:Uncharacterized protein n=2 Tax=viral metagenome TaxID=1070528 RepID=A0A6H1ZKB7_9ZZZZ